MTRPVTGDMLRRAMRHVPSPVMVVTAAAEQEARGITIGSFASVSLEPPLVSFNVHREARMHELLPEAERFAVHVLRANQAHLSVHFAVPDRTGAEQFRRIPHTHTDDGIPILEGVLSVLFCRMHTSFEAGDHTIFIGRVDAIEHVSEGEPLLYYRRSYHAVGSEVRSTMLEPVNRASIESP